MFKELNKYCITEAELCLTYYKSILDSYDEILVTNLLNCRAISDTVKSPSLHLQKLFHLYIRTGRLFNFRLVMQFCVQGKIAYVKRYSKLPLYARLRSSVGSPLDVPHSQKSTGRTGYKDFGLDLIDSLAI